MVEAWPSEAGRPLERRQPAISVHSRDTPISRQRHRDRRDNPQFKAGDGPGPIPCPPPVRSQALCTSVATVAPNEANWGGCRAGTPNLRRDELCRTKPNGGQTWGLAPRPGGRPRTDCANEANRGLPGWSRPNGRPAAPAARLAPIGFV